MDEANNNRRGTFHKVHTKLKTAGIIYDSFIEILMYLRKGGIQPQFRPSFISRMDTISKDARAEQELISWDQMLYGRIIFKCRTAYGMFYGNNPDTRSEIFLRFFY